MARPRAGSLEGALVRDILANPADDAPRLVYADWLEENGDSERAEFVRVQIEHARLDPDDEQRQALAQRAQTLVEAHGKRWCESLPRWAGPVSWWFRRGFVADVVAPAEQFLAGAGGLRRLVPLEGASLRGGVSARLTDLVDGRALSGLVHLELWG